MNDRPFGDDAVLRTVTAARRPLGADDISPTGARATAIVERVIAGDVSDRAEASLRRTSRRRMPVGGSRVPRPGIALGVSVIALCALVLVLAGAFSGPATTGTQSADAAVLRHVAAALDPKPGTILIEKMRVTYTSGNDRPQDFELEQVFQTPTGPGPQNSLYVTTAPGGPSETAVNGGNGGNGGNEEVYLKRTNTIYITSIWGSYISKGPLPELQIAPVAHFPSETASFRKLIQRHLLTVAGTTTIDGRPAIKLIGPRFNIRRGNRSGDDGVEAYIDPKTCTPIEEIVNRPPLFTSTQIWTEYSTLPITDANERLLSLAARHPPAMIDHNHADYDRAANGVVVFTR